MIHLLKSFIQDLYVRVVLVLFCFLFLYKSLLWRFQDVDSWTLILLRWLALLEKFIILWPKTGGSLP